MEPTLHRLLIHNGLTAVVLVSTAAAVLFQGMKESAQCASAADLHAENPGPINKWIS
jgi:hypothetical protein